MEQKNTPAHREADESANEYSDLASVHSDNETKQRRKHKRGGRKTSYEEPTPEETAGLLGPEDEKIEDDYKPDEDETCQYCSRKPKPAKIERQPRRRIQEPFETGIRAFNVRKAAGSRRPVGVRATPEKKSTRKPAPPTLNRKSSSKSDDAGYETQSEGSTSKAAEPDEVSEETEEESAGKPMSIRLDLDLMIEVFLKAKIKGAVTITFLE
ncbi:hypothetical protein ONS95_008479 [Cadophora gregata]|uniref:uncharacterized protein n=1 Tax=Cadophora gregata TaxID=51156 RepID=UPI0026DA7F86|nr:uncharacterized protein ONS95_008479 [Cadophora gregata]KAK0100140.1 hypothetical protein ONS95_008479 [Cadophora gregata]KAK0114915.1 hypothetical protein ONS96_013390 [Cadophora gregata f. sp. sojae]